MIVSKDLALIIFAFIFSAPILLSLVAFPVLNVSTGPIWAKLLSKGIVNLLAGNGSYPQEPSLPDSGDAGLLSYKLSIP